MTNLCGVAQKNVGDEVYTAHSGKLATKCDEVVGLLIDTNDPQKPAILIICCEIFF